MIPITSHDRQLAATIINDLMQIGRATDIAEAIGLRNADYVSYARYMTLNDCGFYKLPRQAVEQILDFAGQMSAWGSQA